ncbi:Choline/Carnitine o-acyltransferase-domain-containing protein [Naematelia encephala]|uniref:Choline/Carnitine o-acyltransferase-domain-containing protein n=1 Tax=Naematelia encephala TaxID=71784 RepID=A0A1Y2BJA1_9TREE|nr:Choline/Carnitine o-acyltransferase-domain-containing protein [Naematelia encephala]
MSISSRRLARSLDTVAPGPLSRRLLTQRPLREHIPRRMFASTSFASNEPRPKTFSQQHRLPRLPVPDLEKSLEAYVKSLVPVLEQKYDAGSLSKELEKRKLFAKDFAAPGGLGRMLQERLKDLDHISPHNWLDDTLWLGLAYHTWRAPLLVNSNWWLLLAPDPKDKEPSTYADGGHAAPNVIATPNPAPSAVQAAGSQGGGEEWIKSHPQIERGLPFEQVVKHEPVTDWQIRRASWLARRYAEFRLMLQREVIPPDSSKAGAYCMSQYQKLFNFSRIPLPGSDHFSTIAPRATHTTLIVNDFIYSVDVFAPASSPDDYPEPLPVAEIERRFKAVVEDAKLRESHGEVPMRVGLLTGDERDTWTKNRERLIQLSPTNRQTLDALSTSLMCFCLDPYTLPSIPSDDPLRHPAVDAQVRNSATGINGGRNRWFDKPMSVIVETTGRTSFSGEHSPVDALIPSFVIEYVLAKSVDVAAFSDNEQTNEYGSKGWERCDWVTDEELLQEIDECQKRNMKLIEDSDASQLWWGEFGVDWIKKHGKQSPDAFIQQALQLAWYKDQGYASATYETASTRMFQHGRTDVIRTLSSDSRAFVAGMLNPELDDKTRFDLLTKACTTHSELTRASSTGQGFDRHLMGLKVHLRPGETHALFEDEMYAKSQEWKFSTSGLSPGPNFMGTGFGAAWPDGYGINYLPGPNLIKFGIESKHSCPVTSTARFKHNIVQSLRDIRRVCEAAAVGGSSGDLKAKF